jgi:hypothetical protein
MRLSALVASLIADLEANGDTENVLLGVVVTANDGKKYRLDAVIAESADISISRDYSFPHGMACVTAGYKEKRNITITEQSAPCES